MKKKKGENRPAGCVRVETKNQMITIYPQAEVPDRLLKTTHCGGTKMGGEVQLRRTRNDIHANRWLVLLETSMSERAEKFRKT
jgi:hypothetical protein